MLRRASGIVAASLLAVALGGCAGLSGAPVSIALSEQQGFPADAPIGEPFDDPTWAGQPVGWLAEDRATLTIVSYGSSSCPFVATAIEALDDSIVEIALRQAPAQACTDDLAPRTHVLAVPEGWGQGDGPYIAEVSQSLDAFGPTEPALSTVVLWPVPSAGESIAIETIRGVPDDITLPDEALDRGEPLAYWGTDRATLRVITWGSSSCPPLVRSAVLASPTVIELVLVPGPGEVCTADFAPTTHVLVTPLGVDAAADVTLDVLLENDERPDQSLTVPIAD